MGSFVVKGRASGFGDEFADAVVEGVLIGDEGLERGLGHQIVERGAALPARGLRDPLPRLRILRTSEQLGGQQFGRKGLPAISAPDADAGH